MVTGCSWTPSLGLFKTKVCAIFETPGTRFECPTSKLTGYFISTIFSGANPWLWASGITIFCDCKNQAFRPSHLFLFSATVQRLLVGGITFFRAVELRLQI